MSLKEIKSLARDNVLYRMVKECDDKKVYRTWLRSGRPIPPPHAVKQAIVKDYARKYKPDVFIETGTYLGAMVESVKDVFPQIYSIELSKELYCRAKRKYARYRHISIINGDSARILPQLLSHISGSCLFWFDAHYSEGITAKGDKETPILEELERAFDHPGEDHIFLIDDAREFTGKNDYPKLEELKSLFQRRYPRNIFEVKDDIIRSYNSQQTVYESFPTKLEASLFGDRRFQPFWGRIQKLALRKMNVGQGGSVRDSGELWVIDELAKCYSDRCLFFDVGANVGDYAMAVLSRFGKRAELYCFEPSAKAFEVLSERLRSDGNIHLYNFGFGKREEGVFLYSDVKGSGLASVYERRLEHFGIRMNCTEEIKLKTIDGFCQQHGIRHIHFLKVDVEGHELRVLAGAAAMIKSQAIDYIQFEFGGCNIDSKTFFQDFYYELNPYYRIFRILKKGLFQIDQYQETNEIFITTNFLAISRRLPWEKWAGLCGVSAVTSRKGVVRSHWSRPTWRRSHTS